MSSPEGQRVVITVVHHGHGADEIVHELTAAATSDGAEVDHGEDGVIVVHLAAGDAEEAADGLRRLALLRNDHADELVRIEPAG